MTVSKNDTTVFAGSGASITDGAGTIWTITKGGQVAVNGTADPSTGNVLELAYVNGVIWQKNSQDLWWGKTSPGAVWAPTYGTSAVPLPVTASLNDTVAYSSSMLSAAFGIAVVDQGITDASGNTWAVDTAGQVTVNGVVDPTTAHVIELAYVNGEVWQENASYLWWSKTSPAGAWSPTYGTAISPLHEERPLVDIGILSATGSGSKISDSLPIGYSNLTLAGIDISNYTLTFSYDESGSAVITGNSTITHSTLQTKGPPPQAVPSGSIVNDGVMTLSASTLNVAGVEGTGTVVATGNSVVEIDAVYSTTNTIQLTSGHLYLGSAPHTQYYTVPDPGMNVPGPITDFNAASAITLYSTPATSEVFTKTAPTVGDLKLYDGATEVANLHISGAANVYASVVPGTSGLTEQILLTTTRGAGSLPIHG